MQNDQLHCTIKSINRAMWTSTVFSNATTWQDCLTI